MGATPIEPNNSSTTRRTLKAHSNLIYSVITEQAGTLSKAVLEGAMNSIDAGADRLDITLTHDKLVLRDNGKGFKDKTEIEEFFETFGTPHVEGDAKYGKFRMGRGQLFAYGHNVWRTGNFEMTVNVKEWGLDWDFKDDLPHAAGCEIVIDLYEPLDGQSIYYITNDVRKMLKWVETPIFINDVQVNETPTLDKFPDTTAEAFIKITNTDRGLDVYNQGVFVCTLPKWRHGVSGVVTSKVPLKVNFARNDIKSECPVWRKILPALGVVKDKQTRTKMVLSEGEAEHLILELVAGTKRIYNCDSMRFVEDVNGRRWSPNQIKRAGFQWFSVGREGDQFCDRLMQTKTAFVMSDQCAELFDRADKMIPTFLELGLTFSELDVLRKDQSTDHVVVAKAEWTRKETVWIELCRTAYYDLFDYRAGKNRREILLGSSNVALGWTDGANKIFIAREFLSEMEIMRNGVPHYESITKLVMLLAHEMCHDTDSRENIHSPDFYEAYHDLTHDRVPAAIAKLSNYVTPARYKTMMDESKKRR